MPPLSLMIKPASSLCNFRCAYCFYADVAANRENYSYGLMSKETLQTLVRRAFAYADGPLSFAFQGGEPTLAGKDFFRFFLSLLRQYNHRRLPVSLGIQTNGWEIDEEWCAIFREGNFLVGVSLDGMKELHDAYRRTAAGDPTWDRILQNTALLRKQGVEYNVLCVVNQQIASRPRQVFHALMEHRYLQFIPCLDSFDGKPSAFSLNSETYGRFLIETFDLYEKYFFSATPVSIRNFDNWIGMLKGYAPENCAMAGKCGVYYLIEADGSVYPCDFYVLDDWRLGNITKNSFYTLEKSETGRAFRSASYFTPEKCQTCKWYAICRGGCKRDREPLLEEKTLPNRLCAGHQMFFDARLDRLQALAKRLG